MPSPFMFKSALAVGLCTFAALAAAQSLAQSALAALAKPGS